MQKVTAIPLAFIKCAYSKNHKGIVPLLIFPKAMKSFPESFMVLLQAASLDTYRVDEYDIKAALSLLCSMKLEDT